MQIWVEPPAHKEIKRLPAHVQQRIKKLIKTLSSEPRPHHSRQLATDPLPHLEMRRVRLDNWRVIYVIDVAWDIITILAIRKRPPYDYEDLPEFLERL